ncbi:Gti1/Pac2 family-domain-containing protein [Globomyces pollinis-pini]|nr:Gti1/Pac2 family-domain-containing protein [Globomyces pollinis-pini]
MGLDPIELVNPSFLGYVETPNDAVLLIEAARLGIINICKRRLNRQERERIQSGYCYIFNDSSGIQRWTDGRQWGPSRILGNFLLYKEIDAKLSPSAHHKSKEFKDTLHASGQSATITSKGTYMVKKNGLLKKTISVQMDTSNHKKQTPLDSPVSIEVNLLDFQSVLLTSFNDSYIQNLKSFAQ